MWYCVCSYVYVRLKSTVLYHLFHVHVGLHFHKINIILQNDSGFTKMYSIYNFCPLHNLISLFLILFAMNIAWPFMHYYSSPTLATHTLTHPYLITQRQTHCQVCYINIYLTLQYLSFVHSWQRPTGTKCPAIKLILILLRMYMLKISSLYRQHSNDPLRH